MMPTRRVEQVLGGYMVYVKPPPFLGSAEVSVFLTPEQYERYLRWLSNSILIQNALPDLSESEREKLMTGLSDEDFNRIAGGD